MNTQERLVKKLKAMYDELQMLRMRVAELERKPDPTPRCDEPGCGGIAEYIVSTPTGYRWSCEKHRNTKDMAVLDSIDDDSPCCDGNPTPPETT